MTTYGAYDAGLPCKNPNCKSHGKPHPNCHCYGAMAHGGDVSHYCSEARAHDQACEYFAAGGQVVPNHEDAHHSVSAYLAHGGLAGVLSMSDESHPDSQVSLGRYNQTISRGHKRIEAKIKSLFEGVDHKEDLKAHQERAHKKIHDWLEEGGALKDLEHEIHNSHPQNLAEGGEVKKRRELHDRHVAEAYPEQNLMLQAAKGRMSQYLGALKPQKNSPKLMFDREPDTREKEKNYKKAVSVAANPLQVLDKIKNGTLKKSDMENLKNLHPEVEQMLQMKMTERMVKDQLQKKKPSLKTRQGLSTFFGVPMSSELTPQNMMAAQATFKKGQPEQQGAPAGGGGNGKAPKKSTSNLTKYDDSFLTSNQARIGRDQKQ